MKNIKHFENYEIESFTEQDMQLALLAMSEWILEALSEGAFDMSPQDKADEIIRELANKKMVISVPQIKNKWSALDLTALKDKKWHSTLTRRK